MNFLICLKDNDSESDPSEGNQLHTRMAFVQASQLALLEFEHPAYREHFPPLTEQSSNTSPPSLPSEKTLQYIQPARDWVIPSPTPPCSQQRSAISEVTQASNLKSVSRPLEVARSSSSLRLNDFTQASNAIQPDLFIPTTLAPSSQKMLSISETRKSVSRPLEVAHSSSSLCSNDIATNTIQPDLFIPTPPSSQQMSPISEASKSVSRPLEIAHSSSSLCSNDSDITMDDSDGKLLRILTTVKDMVNRQCRVCWVSREVSHPHVTFRCPTNTCSGSEWKAFKLQLNFPRGVICYFCFSPFGPPFNHARAPLGTRQSHELCEYPDALKELTYILYRDQSLREKVFFKLGVSPPTTLHQYKQYITKMQAGGILGVYKVIDAYLDIRGSE